MIVYRITSQTFSKDIKGSGSAQFPGRWNKSGIPVLYTGESKEIALLETLVHASPLIIPNLDILTIEIPDDSISEYLISNLPANWANYPAPSKLSEIGEKWILKGDTIALIVPSCIIDTSRIIILNCNHKDYHKVKVLSLTKFHLDQRLIRP